MGLSLSLRARGRHSLLLNGDEGVAEGYSCVETKGHKFHHTSQSSSLRFEIWQTIRRQNEDKVKYLSRSGGKGLQTTPLHTGEDALPRRQNNHKNLVS